MLILDADPGNIGISLSFWSSGFRATSLHTVHSLPTFSAWRSGNILDFTQKPALSEFTNSNYVKFMYLRPGHGTRQAYKYSLRNVHTLHV